MKKFVTLIFGMMSMIACQNSSSVPASVPVAVDTSANVTGAFEEPSWFKNAVLYELNIRNFSPAGNFVGVTEQLPRLHELGVDVVWLMPIFPIGEKNRKGHLGSPYSVSDYKSVHPEFGTTEDFRQLVQLAHELGMKVILDWVPNHTAWDHVWMQKQPDFYTKYNGNFTVPLNEHGEPITDWSDVVDLDYSNPEMRLAMLDALKYWLVEFDVDGYRMDMAGLVPNDFWQQARPVLNAVKPVFMLSEWQDEPKHFESCFQVNYGWRWKDVTKQIATGNASPLLLDTLKAETDAFYPNGYCQLLFTQNHDENSHNGTETELYGAAADAFNVLAFTYPGMPLIYNGQEDGLKKRLKFFEKDPIRWGKCTRTEFFQKLCAVRKNNPALWSGQYGGNFSRIKTNVDDKVFAFARARDGAKVIVLLNLSKTPQNVIFEASKENSGDFTNLFGHNSISITGQMQFNLAAWDYLVLTNR